jgi:phage-related protein
MINKGITINDIHTFYDLNLILSASEIPPAEPKTTYIDIPGADGSLDLTEANGEVKYSDRDLKFTFTIIPDATTTFEEQRTEVVNAFNGKMCKVILDRDEDFYYQGRCSVDEYSAEKNLHQITLTIKAKPYKYKLNITKREFVLTQTPTTYTLANARKSVVPSITCTNDNTVITFNSGTYNLSAGKHKILDILLVDGNNYVTVSGNGTVTFEYQEGEL